MKTRVILLHKKRIFMVLLLTASLLIFVGMLMRISVNTMNYYDPIYKGNANEKNVAFACNVVWGNEYIPDMLKILKEYGIKTTFFIGGEWATKNPDLLLSIYNDGHELGNHGYRHLKHSKLNHDQNIREILSTEEAVKKITGYKTKLFAPPYGDLNSTVVSAAESIQYKVIMWSIDTIDWNTKEYEKVLERVGKKHHNGAIILMHPTKVTIQALPSMIKNLEKEGYRIVTVSDVLEQ